jgi:hypothetical protein
VSVETVICLVVDFVSLRVCGIFRCWLLLFLVFDIEKGCFFGRFCCCQHQGSSSTWSSRAAIVSSVVETRIGRKGFQCGLRILVAKETMKSLFVGIFVLWGNGL